MGNPKRMALICAGLMVCSVMVAAAAQAQDVSFEDARDLAAGGLGGRVAVLLGNGDGSFQAPQTLGPGHNPGVVVVGDFDGDGQLDVAVVNDGNRPFWADRSVSVFLGNGDGTFQDPANLLTGIHSVFVAVGDFNGDGWLDLAVANRLGGTVSVLINNTAL